jgi:hypothetical protein
MYVMQDATLYNYLAHSICSCLQGEWSGSHTHSNLKIQHPTLLNKWAAIARSVQRLTTDLAVQGSNVSGGRNITRPSRPSLGTNLLSVQ